MTELIRSSRPHSQSGFTLIELLVIIVVLGIAGATLTIVSTRSAEMSARLLRDQQALSLANAILAEVKSMPFTYCDPNDAVNAGTAVSAAGCAIPEVMGAEGSEVRLGVPPNQFNNVSDYNNINLTGASLTDTSGQPVSATLPTVANCLVNVTEAPTAFAGIPATESLLITVNVTCPDQIAPMQVQGIRVRFAPNRYQF